MNSDRSAIRKGHCPSASVVAGMMDRIETVAVTGGLGGAGRWVVDRFASQGCEVVCIDQDRPANADVANVRFFEADLTAPSQALELFDRTDPDAVVHLAAIPDPLSHAGSEVYRNNVLCAHNVLVAAGRVDARISWASSESIYGFPFAESPIAPAYLPIDESHPMSPEDPYGVSKQSGEDLARMVARRHGVQVASVRPSWIQYPGGYEVTAMREAFDRDTLAEAGPDDPAASGYGNLWSYIDVRDFARLVERSLQVDFGGHEAFHCHAAENYVGEPTTEIIEEFYGDLPDRCDLSGEESAFSVKKAGRMLDWTPEHDWRSAESATDVELDW